MNICSCGNIIEEYRWKELGSTKCSSCAQRLSKYKSRRKGIMVWEHKTAPSIQIIDINSFNQYKRDTYRKGSGSILRNKSPKSGSPL